MTLIFVYGTLMRGGQNHHYLAQQQFIGPARTRPGFTLYSLGEYPGMVASTDQQHAVDGEIWSVDEPTKKNSMTLKGSPSNSTPANPSASLHLAPSRQSKRTFICAICPAGPT